MAASRGQDMTDVLYERALEAILQGRHLGARRATLTHRYEEALRVYQALCVETAAVSRE